VCRFFTLPTALSTFQASTDLLLRKPHHVGMKAGKVPAMVHHLHSPGMVDHEPHTVTSGASESDLGAAPFE
jgi:hypothetical protein